MMNSKVQPRVHNLYVMNSQYNICTNIIVVANEPHDYENDIICVCIDNYTCVAGYIATYQKNFIIDEVLLI